MLPTRNQLLHRLYFDAAYTAVAGGGHTAAARAPSGSTAAAGTDPDDYRGMQFLFEGEYEGPPSAWGLGLVQAA